MAENYEIGLTTTISEKYEREVARKWLRLFDVSAPDAETEEWIEQYFCGLLPESTRRELRAKAIKRMTDRMDDIFNPPIQFARPPMKPPKLSGVVHDYFRKRR